MTRYFIITFSLFAFVSCINSKKASSNNIHSDITITSSDKKRKNDIYSITQILIKDKTTGKPLPGTALCVNNVCFVTDTTGMAKLFIPKGKFDITIKYVGYKTKTLNRFRTDLSKDYTITFLLTQMDELLY